MQFIPFMVQINIYFRHMEISISGSSIRTMLTMHIHIHIKFIIGNFRNLQLKQTIKQILFLIKLFFDRLSKYAGKGGLQQQNNKIDNRQDIEINIQIQSLPRDGMVYNYVIEIIQLGLYIQHSQTNSSYSVLIISVFYCVILCILIPINKQKIQKIMLQFFKRTSLFSMYLYAQLVIIVCTIQATLLLFYIYYSQSYVDKILSYFSLGSCFLICLVHATFSLAIVQKQLQVYLKRDRKYKFIIMLLALFVGLIGYPLFVTTFHKGIWFFYLHLSGLVGQFLLSSNNKLMPAKKFIILYVLSIVYLTIQTDKYPIANFHQHSLIQIIILFAIIAIICIISWLRLKQTKKQQNIAEMFDMNISKSNSQSTQQGRVSHNKKIINNININININAQNLKSDIQLQPQITIQ